MVVVAYFSSYRALQRALDNHSYFTDPKTLEFGPAKLVTAGPDWKTEQPWTAYRGFSEDALYFFLHNSPGGWMVSIFPKSAFTLEQQALFREYASVLNRPPR